MFRISCEPYKPHISSVGKQISNMKNNGTTILASIMIAIVSLTYSLDANNFLTIAEEIF